MYIQGYRNYMKGNLEEAEKNFRKALLEDAGNPRVYIWLGRVYAEKKFFSKARALLEAAKKATQMLEPTIAEITGQEPDIIQSRQKKIARGRSLYLEGLSLIEKGEFGKAIEKILDAIQNDPTRSEYYIKLGDLYRDTGDIDGSRESYTRAMFLDERNPLPCLRLASLLEMHGQKNEALEVYKKGLERMDSGVAPLTLTSGRREKKVRDGVLEKIRSLSQERAVAGDRFATVVRREGRTVFLDRGRGSGLGSSDEFRTRFTVVRMLEGDIIRELSRGEALGLADLETVGEILVTRVYDNLAECMVTREKSGGIRVGDYIITR